MHYNKEISKLFIQFNVINNFADSEINIYSKKKLIFQLTHLIEISASNGGISMVLLLLFNPIYR